MIAFGDEDMFTYHVRRVAFIKRLRAGFRIKVGNRQRVDLLLESFIEDVLIVDICLVRLHIKRMTL